jgi:hypothetical protein
MRVADVVMLGKILKLGDGLRGTMNASILSAVTYKGGATFWTQMDDFTNFEKDSPPEISLFFFVREPAGNLALQCMVPLYELSTVGRSLKDLLEFVHETGIQMDKENNKFVPPDLNPCTSSPCAREGSFCSVRNILPGHTHKCACLTGYVGDGKICDILKPPEPTPVHPFCGGVALPLLDQEGFIRGCDEEDPGMECPPLHYCYRSICCPVTPPTTPGPLFSPSPPPSTTLGTIPTHTPSPSPGNTGSGDGVDRGSGDLESGDSVDRGSGDLESGDGVDRGSGDLESGDGVDRGSGDLESGDGVDRGSGDLESGDGVDRGSGDLESGDGVDRGSGDIVGSGSGASVERGHSDITAGQSDILHTFEDDEDMAYGQAWRGRRSHQTR